MRSSFLSLIKRFAREECGASLVEYAVLVGLITAAVIAAVTALGGQISTELGELTTRLSTMAN